MLIARLCQRRTVVVLYRKFKTTMKHLIPVLLLITIGHLNGWSQNIGMHTTIPQAPVHIASSGELNVPGGLLLLGNRSNAHLEVDFDILQSRYSAGGVLPLRLQPGGGNVGIHTFSPGAPLHVASSGEVNTSGGLALLGARSAGHLELDFDRIQSRYSAGSLLPLKLQPMGGNVGIHTENPVAPLHVSSSGQVYTDGGLAVFGNPSEAHLEVDFNRIQSNFGIAGTLPLLLQPDGGNINLANGKLFINSTLNRIGILDDTPDYTLDVNGDIGVLQSIFRKGDNDTYLRFFNDNVQLTAGGVTMLNLVNLAQDYVRLGTGGAADVDVYLNNGLFVHGTNQHQVGIGYLFTAPTARMHVRAQSTETALRVETANDQRMVIDKDGNITFGSSATNPPGTFVSYNPTEINSQYSGTSPALRVNGMSIQIAGQTLSGGYLELGDPWLPSILMDADEIQGKNGLDSNPSLVKINSKGGNVVLGHNQLSRIGINTLSGPSSDLHVYQSYTSGNSASGIRLESNDFKYWRIAINASEELQFYNNSNTLKAWLSPTDGTWSNSSDSTLKKHIRALPNTLCNLARLTPVQYHMKDQDDSDPLINGFIAQEVLEIFPEIVVEAEGKLGLKYQQFIPLAIKGIQELALENAALQIQIEQQTHALQQLQAENNIINDRLARIEDLLSAQSAHKVSDMR